MYTPGQKNCQRPSANLTNIQQETKSQTDSTKGGYNETSKLEDIQDDSWYLDSGATNHVTNNLGNLNLRNKECKVKQCIHMGMVS